MVFKVTSFEKAFPDSDYSSNKGKTYLFAYAGADFWYAARKLIEERNKQGRWCMWAEIPLMHMAIELLIKAFASFYDPSFEAKKYGHHASRIISYYSDKIPVFKRIHNDTKKIEIIKELEQSWKLVRYGEAAQRCDGEEYEILDEIATILYFEYKNITKLPHL